MGKYDQSITDILTIEYEEIQKLLASLDREVMEKIIDLLISVKPNGKKVITAGAGTSGATAIRVAHSLNVCEVPTFFCDPAYSVHGGTGAIQKGDVVILFSYSGATTGGIDILKLANARGIKTILVTRFRKSPAAKLADVVLCCGSNEGPYQFGSVPAKIAQLVVVDMLFQEYFSRNRKICEENIQSIASALSDMHI